MQAITIEFLTPVGKKLELSIKPQYPHSKAQGFHQ